MVHRAARRAKADKSCMLFRTKDDIGLGMSARKICAGSPHDVLCATMNYRMTASSALTELALDLRSAWDHGADHLWRHLDRSLWEFTRNPWTVLQTVSAQSMPGPGRDRDFAPRWTRVVGARRAALDAPSWFDMNHPGSALKQVAYFSMEFMLSEALPIYSGGLGNVAGDQLKSASDLGVPVVGVGLLYSRDTSARSSTGPGASRRCFPTTPGPVAHHPAAYRQRRMAAAESGPARISGVAADLAGAGGTDPAAAARQQ